MKRERSFLETPEQRGECKSLVKSALAKMDGNPLSKILAKDTFTQLQNRYSHQVPVFESGFIANSAFIIDKLHTPKGWFHYLLNLKNALHKIAISVVAQDGSGVLSQDSVLHGPITKLSGNENYMHVSQVYRNSRVVWIKTASGKVFHLNPQPNFLRRGGTQDAEKYKSFSCEQHPGYTVIKARRRGLDSSLRIFVPYELPGEIWTVSVKNVSKKTASFSLYPEINFGLDSHPSHYFVGMAVSEAEYAKAHNAIIAKNLDIKNSFPRWGAFISSEQPAAFDSNADKYYGFGASIVYPAGIFRERLSNTEAAQPLKGMMGAFQYDITLEPGESKQINLAVASIDPNLDITAQLDEWQAALKPQAVKKELAKVTAHWQAIFSSCLIKTPSPAIDETFNVWGKYQGIVCSRFNSPYDIGTRDVFQYLLVNTFCEPDFVRTMIPFLLNYQYADGRIPRQICKFSKLHDLRNFMDCQLWAPNLVAQYVRETGDFAMLDKKVGFLADDNATLLAKNKVSVYEHLIRAVKSAYENNIGAHGLCKLGYGGWNDALDGLRGDKSESVWLSQLLVFAAQEVRCLAQWKKDTATETYMHNLIENMSRAVNETGWDEKGYYIFGYDNAGNPVGSSKNDEGQKHLNENSWALLCGITPQGRIDSVIHAMDELRTPFGMRLLIPYSKKSAPEVGRIADQAKGHFENGSVYQHGALFWAAALLKNGRADEAYAHFELLTNENRLPDITTNPPIYHSNYTAVCENTDYGKEPYYPFTGSHAWRMQFITELMGLKMELDGLRIDPKIPTVWRESVENGQVICKMRKKSFRKELPGIAFLMEIYRDDAVKAQNTMKVRVNDTAVRQSKGRYFISLEHPVFSGTAKEIAITVCL
ncbi:hypothetical protein KDK77_00390 [bacterium]|nr:hypothetical protein [bacterium]